MSIPIPAIPGIKIQSSTDILSEHTKIAQLIWAPSGFGKTTLAGSLDALTQKYDNKRTLYIAVESAEGGGAATIRKVGVPLYVPKDYSDLYKTLGHLRNDKGFGGVVLDSATELYKQHIKPATLKYPSRENVATRAAGVLTRSDYQVAGELTSQVFRQLMLLTTHDDPAYRKHLIVTATDQVKLDEDTDRMIWAGPDLPGRMSREAVQMFQQVSTIEVRAEVLNGKRQTRRFLVSTTDGVLSVKDRFDILPQSIALRKDPTDPTGDDMLTIWEKYWLPAIEAAKGA